VEQPVREFKRVLGLLDSTMIVVGSMIGSGIFIVSADIARSVGSAGYLLLVWVVTGLMTVIAALSYGELAGMMPQAGGQYVYLREAYNPLIGFLYGWTFFLVIQAGTIAAVGVAFAKFTSVLVPWFAEQHVLFAVAGVPFTGSRFLAILSILLLTYVNSRGVRQGKFVQNTFTFAKTMALVGLILIAFLFGRNAASIHLNLSHLWDAQQVVPRPDGSADVIPLSGLMILGVFGSAMVGSLFSSDAWNNITFAAGEVIHPKRTIPLSLVLGTGTVITLYLLANIGYLLVLPLSGSPGGADVTSRGIQFAVSDRVGTATASAVFGDSAAVIMAALIMISTFGCNNGLILAGARVYYAMARDGLFFRSVGTLNSRSVPGAALVVQGVWASLLCLTGTYSNLLDYVMFAVLVFYVLTVAGIIILRFKRPDAERPYRAIGYPYVPVLYILLAAGICVDLLVYKPQYTWPGLGIVVLGIPVYFIWRRITTAGSGSVS